MVFVETVDEFIEKVKQLYQQDPTKVGAGIPD
jgi:hypothetical protein